MDEIIEEARVRGIPVSRVTGHADEYRDWLSSQPEREAAWKPSRLSPNICATGRRQADAG